MKIDKFIKDTGIVFFATMLSSIFNLLYQLFMVRNLSPVSFGELNALLSLTLVAAMPSGTLQTVAAKYASVYKATGEYNQMQAFLKFFLKRLFLFGAVIVVVFTIFNSNIARFFKIENDDLIILLGFSMLASILSPFTLGMLQGLQKFKSMGAASIISTSLKFFLAALLVKLGYDVWGAIVGGMIATFLALIYSFFPLRSYFRKKIKNIALKPIKLDFSEIYKFTLPTLIILPSSAMFTVMDILMVKRFFSPEDAGFYSVAQMIGKIIFFLPGAITLVMFPKITEAYARGEDNKKLFKKCFFLVVLLCAGASAFCIIFPKFILKLLAGSVYPQCLPLVWPFAVSMSFFALSNLFLFYYLSIHKVNFTFVFPGFVLLEALLISVFHTSLLQVLYVLIGCSSALLAVNWITFRRLT